MYPGKYRWRMLLLPLALLVGCSTQSPNVADAPRSGAAVETSTAVTAAPLDTPTIPPVDTPAPQRASSAPVPSLPPGWRYAAWQGLSVPLPPAATGIDPFLSAATATIHNLPILASGAITFPPPPTPPNGAVGEYPAPPTFTLVQFSGTLAEWIELEEKSMPGPEGGVMEPVEPLVVAGREALHYQITVPGFNYNDYYVLKLTDTTLLILYTDKELYGSIIDGLMIGEP